MVDSKINFLDYVELFLKAGNGGNGAIAFLREARNAKGGPAGGDGGNGGDVIIIADKNVRSLAKFRFIHHLRAENGSNGEGKNKTGKRGNDLIIKVPVGTIIYDENHQLVYDFTKHGEQIILLKGGKGGFGNSRFKSAKRVKPSFALKGEITEEKKFIFELKLLADVALVGFPNAGKSTLISKLSNAKPKIANYPFTTLTPHLGIVYTDSGDDFIIADIPGLIEGAHKGKGIGLLFLKHIERCRLFAFILDPTNIILPSVKEQYNKLLYELKAYKEEMVSRPQIIVINKIDLIEEQQIEKIKEIFPHAIFISARENINLDLLKNKMFEMLKSIPIEEKEATNKKIKVIYGTRQIVEEVVYREGKYFIYGRIEKDIQRLDFNQYDALYFFKQYLKIHGVNKILKKKGLKDGDIVVINDLEFTYYEEEK